MPTSTPEFQHKTYQYCNTVAEPLATQCANCGSNLPMALPRPVAKLVEAQSKWSMGKTAFVSIFVSLGLGLTYSSENLGLSLTLMLLWMVLFLPPMLVISAVVTAKSDAGRFILNVFAAIGLWMLAMVLQITQALLY